MRTEFPEHSSPTHGLPEPLLAPDSLPLSKDRAVCGGSPLSYRLSCDAIAGVCIEFFPHCAKGASSLLVLGCVSPPLGDICLSCIT